MRRMPTQSLRIDNARYVVTLDPQRRIIAGGSILVENGRISQVGKAPELAQAPADRVIDARHFLVTPGFVNGHMHISYGHVVRGIFPDDVGSPLPHVFKLQMAMTEEEEHASTLLGLVELLRNGTVCFVDPGSTKFPDACLQAYEDAGIRVIPGECVDGTRRAFSAAAYAAPGDRSRHVGPFSEVGTGGSAGGARVGHAVLAPRRAAPSSCKRLKQLADQHRTSADPSITTAAAKARQDSSRPAWPAADRVPRVERRPHRPNSRARPRARIDRDRDPDCMARKNGHVRRRCARSHRPPRAGRGVPHSTVVLPELVRRA